MSKSVVGHGILLLVTLAAAGVTWSRQSRAAAAPGSVPIWQADPDQLTAVDYAFKGGHLQLERRSDSAGAYVWARFAPAPVGDSTPTPIQFLVGDAGQQVLRDLAEPRALRDLGAADAAHERQYGLTDAAARLEVVAGGVKHDLLVGGPVFASGDRYVKDSSTGRVYVLPPEAITSLETSESSLAERKLHAFSDDDVASAVIRTSRGRTTLRRISAPGVPDAWAPSSSPNRSDPTMSNFMQRVGQLFPVRSAPDVDVGGLTEVVRIDYRDSSDKPLGWLRVLRTASAKPDYYLETEHLRAPARGYAGALEQIARDVEQLFGAGASAPVG